MRAASDLTDDAWEVDVGWPVVTAEGKLLGEVEGVHPYHLIVSTTRPTLTMLFVPCSAITSIDTDCVLLDVAHDDVLYQGWGLIPDRGELTTNPASDSTPVSDLYRFVSLTAAVVMSGAAAFVVVSWLVRPVDVIVGLIFILGVAALGIWAVSIGIQIGRSRSYES